MLSIIVALAFGILASWFLRNLAARAEGRVGPPLLQPLWDLLKLLSKGSVGNVAEVLPLLSLLLVMFAILNLPFFSSSGEDLIVVLYALTASSIFMTITGASSGSPFSVVGGSRELQQTILAELLFIASCFSVVALANSTSFHEIEIYHLTHGYNLLLIPAFVAMLVACQAKLRKAPFDIPDANVEVAGGPMTELSGYALAMHELTYALELYCLPMLASFIFFGTDYIASLMLSVVIIFIMGVTAATNARIRVGTSVRILFFTFILALLVTALIYIGGNLHEVVI